MKNKMQVIDSCVFSFCWKGGREKNRQQKYTRLGILSSNWAWLLIFFSHLWLAEGRRNHVALLGYLGSDPRCYRWCSEDPVRPIGHWLAEIEQESAPGRALYFHQRLRPRGRRSRRCREWQREFHFRLGTIQSSICGYHHSQTRKFRNVLVFLDFDAGIQSRRGRYGKSTGRGNRVYQLGIYTLGNGIAPPSAHERACTVHNYGSLAK